MKTLLMFIVVLVLSTFAIQAQDGTLDNSFTFDTSIVKGLENVRIANLVAQPDGNILCVIFSNSYFQRFNLVRLLTDGSLDNTFPIRRVNSRLIGLQSNGKILIEDSTSNLTRLYSSGYTDTSFKPILKPDPYKNEPIKRISYINALKVLKDDRIIVKGENIIYILSPDGTVDKSASCYQFKGTISTLSSGKIIVSSYNVNIPGPNPYLGSVSPSIIIYNSNLEYVASSFGSGVFQQGSLTGNFTDYKNLVYGCVTYLNDKTLYFGGNGTSQDQLKLLDTNGKVDTSFNPSHGTVRGFEDGYIQEVSPQNDSKIIVVGDFKYYNGIPTPHIVRIDSLGNIDKTFELGTGTDSTIFAVTTLPNNQVLIGGNFSTYNGVHKRYIAKLNIDNTSFINTWRSNFIIKPNPSTDECILDNIPVGYSVTIRDNNGRLVASYPPSTQTNAIHINTRLFASGVYFVFINDNSGHIFNNILTVEH